MKYAYIYEGNAYGRRSDIDRWRRGSDQVDGEKETLVVLASTGEKEKERERPHANAAAPSHPSSLIDRIAKTAGVTVAGSPTSTIEERTRGGRLARTWRADVNIVPTLREKYRKNNQYLSRGYH